MEISKNEEETESMKVKLNTLVLQALMDKAIKGASQNKKDEDSS